MADPVALKQATRADKNNVGGMCDPDSPAVVQTLQSIFAEAFRLGASRVLILPFQGRTKVIYRIEGSAYSCEDPPPEMFYSLLVLLMTMTDLSGGIKVHTGKKDRRVAVTFQPSRYGVCAMLDITHEVSPIDVCRAKAAKLGYVFVDLGTSTVPPEILATVSEKLVREHHVLPVMLDGDILVIAMSDPQNVETLEKLRFSLNRPIAAAMAPLGSILAAIDRYFGSADPQAKDIVLAELMQTAEAPQPITANLPKLGNVAGNSAAKPFIDHLRMVYRDGMLEMFDDIRRSSTLCRQDPVSDNLEVVFPHSHVVARLPAAAQKYLEDKIWTLRAAAISRLEAFLLQEPAARGLAMTYAEYLACCELADRKNVSINPASAHDARINFLYSFLQRSFPAVHTIGTLLKFLAENSRDLSGKIASLLNDPGLVVEPGAAGNWFARLERQTIFDEPVDGKSPPIAHLVELLVAEAVHARASRLLLLPREDRIEVAYRVQNAAYARESLPLRLLFPLLARLRILADLSGTYRTRVGDTDRNYQVGFFTTPQGPMVWLDDVPDSGSVQACRAEAASQGCPFVVLDDVRVPESVLALIPKAIAWRKQWLPLAVKDDQLTIVVSTWPDSHRQTELRLFLHRHVALALAPQDDLRAAIYRHYCCTDAVPTASPLAAALLFASPTKFGTILANGRNQVAAGGEQA